MVSSVGSFSWGEWEPFCLRFIRVGVLDVDDEVFGAVEGFHVPVEGDGGAVARELEGRRASSISIANWRRAQRTRLALTGQPLACVSQVPLQFAEAPLANVSGSRTVKLSVVFPVSL
jgi:hypothetical protein